MNRLLWLIYICIKSEQCKECHLSSNGIGRWNKGIKCDGGVLAPPLWLVNLVESTIIHLPWHTHHRLDQEQTPSRVSVKFAVVLLWTMCTWAVIDNPIECVGKCVTIGIDCWYCRCGNGVGVQNGWRHWNRIYHRWRIGNGDWSLRVSSNIETVIWGDSTS